MAKPSILPGGLALLEAPGVHDPPRPARLRDVVSQAAPESEVVWRSDDGTTSTWRVDRGEWRICTRDKRRARKLARLTEIELVGHSVLRHQFEEYFALTARKLRGETVRRILNGVGQ